MPPTTDNAEEELLAVRRVFQTAHAPGDQWLRYDVFRTRCTVGEKVCSLIIDADMKENVVSARVIEKLHLPTWRHPQPYFLYGLKKKSAIKIDQMCLVDFSIGNRLHEQVWCDVVPMDTCHILLGQPWQLDRKAIYDRLKNTYSFTREKRKIVLLPWKAEATTEPPTREMTITEKEKPCITKYPLVQNDNPPTELLKEEVIPNMPPKEEITPIRPPQEEIGVTTIKESWDVIPCMILPAEPPNTLALIRENFPVIMERPPPPRENDRVVKPKTGPWMGRLGIQGGPAHFGPSDDKTGHPRAGLRRDSGFLYGNPWDPGIN